MTDPLLAHATEYGRMYARSTSEQFSVPSITTVIGQQPHGLDGWFGYMGASSLAKDPLLADCLGSPAKIRQAVTGQPRRPKPTVMTPPGVGTGCTTTASRWPCVHWAGRMP